MEVEIIEYPDYYLNQIERLAKLLDTPNLEEETKKMINWQIRNILNLASNRAVKIAQI